MSTSHTADEHFAVIRRDLQKLFIDFFDEESLIGGDLCRTLGVELIFQSAVIFDQIALTQIDTVAKALQFIPYDQNCLAFLLLIIDTGFICLGGSMQVGRKGTG